VGLLSVGLIGCGPEFGPQAKYGITFYCPGVGNVDMGDAGLRDGLQRAGYRGQVSRLTWSYTFNPVVDQTVQPIARLGGARLASYIQEYIDRYPGCEVNVVGLSAGTGVAVWALESLRAPYQVNNVVLLSSSLSSDYDVSHALTHTKGRIFNYYSPHDAVLTQLMRVACTIDGKIAAEGAGAVGLHPPRGAERIVNIEWNPEFARYSYCGGHMDNTSPDFVRVVVSRHIVTDAPPLAAPGTAHATLTATTPPDARPQ
jgi:pimeloyl-ACP methyl ester carboxylesterase